MYGSQIFHGFYFDDQFLLNQQVYAIPSFQKNPLVHKRDRHLLLNMKPTYAKLVNKQPFIHRFQQPRPNCAMNIYRRTNNRIRCLIRSHKISPYPG